jgi:hypothetical protein
MDSFVFRQGDKHGDLFNSEWIAQGLLRHHRWKRIIKSFIREGEFIAVCKRQLQIMPARSGW